MQTKDENVFVWVNEEDHSRLISMEKGDDVKGIVSRFIRLTKALQGQRWNGFLVLKNQLPNSTLRCSKERRQGFYA